MFTNISSPLSWNFSPDTIPKALKDAPQFLLNNPVALQRRYLELKDDPSQITEMREVVKSGEEKALGMLVHLFDWLHGLKPQLVTKVQNPHEKSLSIKRTQLSQIASSDGEIFNNGVRIQSPPSLRV